MDSKTNNNTQLKFSLHRARFSFIADWCKGLLALPLYRKCSRGQKTQFDQKKPGILLFKIQGVTLIANFSNLTHVCPGNL